MGFQLITAPAEEPLTIAQAKEHLRVTTADEDALIASLIIAARGHAESYTHRRFITQTWDWTLDAFPEWCVELPYAPLQSVTSINYIDTAGATQLLAGSSYQADAKTDPGRLMPAYGSVWPSTRAETFNAVTIRFVCGYGLAAAVPREIKAALLLIVGHLFEHREQVSDFQTFEVPNTVEHLLSPFRIVRF